MSALAAVPHRPAAENDDRRLAEHNVPPIVAAIDGSTASRAAIGDAVRLAAELNASVVFVYVRRGPAGFFGTPVYQRRLTKEMTHARRVLDHALAVADNAGVPAEGEILEGSPRRRILEFARDRGAQLVVVGSRRRRIRRSVAYALIRGSDLPVMVAAHRPTHLALERAA
jgi:nucleotide-binding universal stress UspA family protein